jgi:hypothetical protein
LAQQRDATMAAVALARYYLMHEKWPESLHDLVPSLLPAVPSDRFDGQPLRYRLVDGRPLLYSVGTDLNDDGGTPYHGNGDPWWVANWPPDPSIDGDWILWPPMARDAAVTFVLVPDPDDPAAEREPRSPPEPKDDSLGDDPMGDDHPPEAEHVSAEPCR